MNSFDTGKSSRRLALDLGLVRITPELRFHRAPSHSHPSEPTLLLGAQSI